MKGRERLMVTILVMEEVFGSRRSRRAERARLLLRVMMIVMILHLRQSIVSLRKQ